MADIRCGGCKETFEIESVEYSADYDCPYCGKNVHFTSELDHWVKKVHCEEINPDFVLLKRVRNDRLDGIIMALCLIVFGGFMLLAWMFIITIPLGIFLIKGGIKMLFFESTTRETHSVYDESNSRIVYFEYENGELINSSQTKIKVEPRCKIISYRYWSGGGDTGNSVLSVFITQKNGPVIAACSHESTAKEFAQYLGISYENKGDFDTKGVPDESNEWVEW